MVTFTENEVIEIVSAKTPVEIRLRLEKLTVEKVFERERAKLIKLYSCGELKREYNECWDYNANS